MRLEQGFTLVELMVAMVVGSIAIASAYASYDVIAKQYEKVKGVTAMQSSSRSIMRMIERDIRMAGFKWRDSKGTITFGSISEPIKITDSGNKCCDAVTVTYDYRDEASKKVERHKIHYSVSPYQGRNRLYRKRDILFPKARAGNNDVLADYVENLQFSDPDSLSDLPPLPNDSSNCDRGPPHQGSWSHTGYCKKLDKDGKVLPDKTPTWDFLNIESVERRWRCTKDEYTGLTWEMKHVMNSAAERQFKLSGRLLHWIRGPGDRRPMGLYRWGGVGAKAGSHGTYYNDWNVLVNGSNNENLCGRSNWRVPTLSELNTTRSFRLMNPPYSNKFYFGEYYGKDDFWAVDASWSGGMTLQVWGGANRPINSAKKHYVRLVSSEESSTRLIMIDLVLRTKKEFGPARSYTKKSYAGGNYKINKNDAYKRQEYSSTVLIRNPL